jgi:aspartyl-tRNA synthetase
MYETIKGLKRSHRCTEVNERNINQTVTVMGWVQKRRDLGGVIFIDLRDRTGLLQIVFDQSIIGSDGFKKAEQLGREYVVAVTGIVEKRSEETINSNLKTGTIEVKAKELRILSVAETIPFELDSNKNIKEELRLKYRYLDLRRPELQEKLMLRHKICNITRNFLNDEGFLEIETPMLTKSSPEGARDYLVPSRVHPGSFYALPQSPQLFKQLLMLSGFDRYYQIARCFRDEDLRADRQPEFTQIDMELSFVNVDDVIDVNERLIYKIFKETIGVEVPLPIPRMTYEEAMNRFGSDKPDTRFGIELKDLTNILRNSEFQVFRNVIDSGGSVRGINAKGCAKYTRSQIEALGEYAAAFGAKGMAWIQIDDNGEYKSTITKFLKEEELNGIIDILEGKPGDLLLFCADKNDIVFNTLGNLRLKIAEQESLINNDEYKFLWITEFPLLEYSPEQKRFVAKHHPFTSPMDEDIPLMDTNPEKVRAKAYDLTLNGNEIGGGSIRIHQRDVQHKMFNLLGFTKEEAEEKFGFLLNAFKYGVPPHGGLAYGLDRVAMLISKSESIRDVIAFPKTKDATCLMTEAPSKVDEKQLDELEIKVKE